MTPAPVISNSSPLIALLQLGHLDLLKHLFSEVIAPTGVVREIAGKTLPSWIIELSLEQPIGPQILRASLGPGEAQALALAVELRARWIVLDDRPARRVAEALDIPLIGTLGILLASKRRGLIPAVRPLLDSLVSFGFRVAPGLYDRVLVDAGESQ